MSRLKKKAEEVDNAVEQVNEPQEEQVSNANFDTVKNLLDRIDSGAEDIKANYYSLLENLNALYADYPGVYNEMKVMVKLPVKNDVSNIAKFKDDVDRAVQMLKDDNFLSGIVK